MRCLCKVKCLCEVRCLCKVRCLCAVMIVRGLCEFLSKMGCLCEEVV